MANHKVYRSIVKAVTKGLLKEPFTSKEFQNACPDLVEGTYSVFLHKHRKGNPGGNSELLEKISPGQFKLIRPIKYGINEKITKIDTH